MVTRMSSLSVCVCVCVWAWEGVPMTVCFIQFVFALHALCSLRGSA